MINLSADLAENILNGLYLLFTHNGLVLTYFFGLLLCGLITFFKPSRLGFILTLSFATLTFGYEYDKHLIGPLREQTLSTIAPVPGTHLRASKLVNLLLSELLPIFFFMAGWGLLLASITYTIWKQSKKQ